MKPNGALEVGDQVIVVRDAQSGAVDAMVTGAARVWLVLTETGSASDRGVDRWVMNRSTQKTMHGSVRFWTLRQWTDIEARHRTELVMRAAGLIPQPLGRFAGSDPETLVRRMALADFLLVLLPGVDDAVS